MTVYTVRQHIPDFVSGVDPIEVERVAREDLANPEVIPWLRNFEAIDGFETFVVKPYIGDRLLVSAKYADGTTWVAHVARPSKEDRL